MDASLSKYLPYKGNQMNSVALINGRMCTKEYDIFR